MEAIMKFFNLQHFAEGEENTNTEQAGEQTTETNEGSQEQKPAEKTFTQAEVNEIVEKRLAREREKAQQKETEAQKLASMNEKERADYEKNNLLEENKKLKAQIERGNMLTEARTMLSAENVNVPNEIVEMLVSGDADSTKANVTAFVNSYREAIKQEVANQLKGATPTGGSSSTVTKEQIEAIKDPIERQKQIREHMELFA